MNISRCIHNVCVLLCKVLAYASIWLLSFLGFFTSFASPCFSLSFFFLFYLLFVVFSYWLSYTTLCCLFPVHFFLLFGWSGLVALIHCCCKSRCAFLLYYKIQEYLTLYLYVLYRYFTKFSSFLQCIPTRILWCVHFLSNNKYACSPPYSIVQQPILRANSAIRQVSPGHKFSFKYCFCPGKGRGKIWIRSGLYNFAGSLIFKSKGSESLKHNSSLN